MECHVTGTEKIAQILLGNLPKSLLVDIQERFAAAIERSWQVGGSTYVGHRSTVVGNLRHYFLNEALMHSLEESGSLHGGLRGNKVVVGSVGITAVARVHQGQAPWNNSKRSASKRKLCERNEPVTALMQPDFLQPVPVDVTELTVFLVTEGDGSSERPAQVSLVVPDHNMDLRNPLFVESLTSFIHRYEQANVVVDKAQPKLKTGIKSQNADTP